MTKSLHLLEAGLQWPPETFLQRKMKTLAARGVRVTVAARVSRRAAAATRLEGVELKRIPVRGESLVTFVPGLLADGLALALTNPRCLKRLVGAVSRALPGGSRSARAREALAALRLFMSLARLRPDVMHFEWNGWAVNCMPLIEAWDRPVLTSCRGGAVNVRPLDPAYADLRRGLPASFELSAAVHCVSDDIQREAERYGLDPAKSVVIRPAVDPSFFTPPSGGRLEPDRLRVAAVGTLRWQKGFEYALVAIRDLADRGVPVWLGIVGAEPAAGLAEVSDLQRIRYTIADLGLHEMVRMLGHAPPEGVRDHLQRADVFLQPSVTEGLPNVVLEAMACELPVVAADAGGTREAVEDGVHGLVVPTRDPGRMADALEQLWHDRDLRERMGRTGRGRVESEFNLDLQADRFVELYRTVLERHSSAAAAQ